MHVCNCLGINEKTLMEAIEKGATTYKALQTQLGVATCCGLCKPDVKKYLTNTSECGIINSK